MAAFLSLPLRSASAAAVLLGLATGAASAQQRVGVNSAVNQQASGTPPGAATRQLVVGQDVVFNERIATTGSGQTQLLFLDESSMTVGPNSDLTIDQFVYDPKSGSGKLAMSATSGLLRYVGGKLSKHDEGVTLRTSTATLAVRGGAFIVRVDRNGRTEAIFIFGDGLTVTGLNGVSETIRRPGFEIVVSGRGASPSAPAPVPPAVLAQLVQQLDGRTGGNGGAAVIPTEATVAQSGIATTVSGNLAASVQQAAQNQPIASVELKTTPSPLNSSALPVPIPAPVGPQPNSASQVIDCVTANTCNPTSTVQIGTTTSGQPIGGNPFTAPSPTPPPPTPPVTVVYAGRVKNTNGQGTARGFVGPAGDTAYAGGVLSFPSGAPQNGVFTANVGGTVGTISFPLVPGRASFQGSSSALGTLSGSSFLAADDSFFYADITPTGQPSERLFIYGGLPANASAYAQTGSSRVLAFAVQPDAALQSNMPFVRSQEGGNLPNASVSPLYVAAPPTTPIGDTSTTAAARGLQASLAISGQGAGQQSAIAVTTGTISQQANGQPIFTGTMRGSSMASASGTPTALSAGVGSAVDANGNSFYGSGNQITGFVLNQSPSATATPLSGAATTYGFAQPAIATATPAGVGASRTTQALTGSFGGLMYTNAQTNPYIVTGATLVSTDAPNNRVQATMAGNAQSPSAGVSAVTMQYGSLSGAAGSQAFIDNNNFAAAESAVNPQQITINGTPSQPTGQLYFASSGTAPPTTSLLPAGVSYCQCQYLQWGYWGGTLTSAGAPGTPPRIDAGNINSWVAGVPTAAGDLNSLIGQSATATYNGHAFGSVFNNGASYVAAGGFTGTYNFGTQNGTVAVNNFDGHSFVASGTAPLIGPNYSLSSTVPGFTGSVRGTFYGPMAAETGGSFAFQSTAGPSYLASGIFAGSR